MYIEDREDIEWVNYWWEKANDCDIERWVLLGDSVARQFRKKLQINVTNVAIDFWGVSLQLDDKRFEKELRNFFDSEYKYNLAIITWGGHHGLDRRTNDIQKYQNYYSKYEELLLYVKSKCQKVIIVAVTHEVLQHSLQTLDEEKNEEIISRNIIAKEIAHKHNLQYIDLYNYMYNQRDIFPHTDHVHFTRDADEIIAKYILDSINLNNNNKTGIHYKKPINSIKDLEKIIKDSKKIVLYGAGYVGKEFAKYIEERGKKIECFIVSDNENLANFNKLKYNIYHLSELEHMLHKYNVIVTMMVDLVGEELYKRALHYWKPEMKVIDFIIDYNSL